MAVAASPDPPNDSNHTSDEPSKDGQRAPIDPVDDAIQAIRMDSGLHVGKTSQKGDLAEQVCETPPPVQKKQVKKPGILTNEHADAEKQVLRIMNTTFRGWHMTSVGK